jgi:hypothetical protein
MAVAESNSAWFFHRVLQIYAEEIRCYLAQA